LKETSLSDCFEGWKNADIPFLQQDDKEIKKALLMLPQLYAKVEPFILEGQREARGCFQFKTFCHGDTHLGNLAFPCDAEQFARGEFERVLFVDWQMYGDGWGAAELQYFMNLSVGFSPELYEILLHEYYDSLISHLDEGMRQAYPYDIFLKECITFAVYAGAGLVLMMKMLGTYEDYLEKLKTDHKLREFSNFLIPLLNNSYLRLAYIAVQYATLFDEQKTTI
jgi:hypothetical protein